MQALPVKDLTRSPIVEMEGTLLRAAHRRTAVNRQALQLALVLLPVVPVRENRRTAVHHLAFRRGVILLPVVPVRESRKTAAHRLVRARGVVLLPVVPTREVRCR